MNWIQVVCKDGKRGIDMSEMNVNQENVMKQASGQPMEGNASPVPVVAPGQPIPIRIPKQDTEHTKRMKANFSFFGPVTFVYALFYTFCMYHNGSGVTFPFFVAGSLLFLCFSLSKLEISLKKGSSFYMISMMLLGVSTFCTSDARIIIFNKLGIFLLMMSLLLKQFYDTSQWKLGKYFLAIGELVFACLGELGRPFSDASAYFKKRDEKRSSRIGYVALGALIALPLVLVVWLLLASADVVFREMSRSVFQNANIGNVCNVVFRILFLYFFSYLLTAYLCKHTIKETVKDRRNSEPVLAITVTGMLSVMYLLFSGVQIVYLFLGKMQLPEGYTYAEYAREGFFQLLAVSILNLVIVLFVMSFFLESKVLKAVLTVMSFCTFIMIASSAMRMIIYIQYYYLTFLRILVLWSLVVLAFLFLGVIASIFKKRFPLFRYSMVVVTVLYLALSFLHPDYVIARVNLANVSAVQTVQAAETEGRGGFFRGNAYQDYRYLFHLSADAAPVVIPYLVSEGYDTNLFYEENVWEALGLPGENYGRKALDGYQYLADLQAETENFSLRTFNISRYMAIKKIAEYSSQVVPANFLENLMIQNDADVFFTRISYDIHINGHYIAAESMYQEEIDTYYVTTGDNGYCIDLGRWHLLEKEYPELKIHVTLTFDVEGEEYMVEQFLVADESGAFPETCVLSGDAAAGFEILPAGMTD